MLMLKAYAENTSNGPKAQDEAYTRWAAGRGAQQFGVGRNTALRMTRQNAANRTRRMGRDNFVNRVTNG